MGVLENKRVIVHRSRKMDKRRRTLQLIMRFLLAGIVIAAIAFGIYMLTFFGKTRVNLRDLTTVTLTGYDGEGQANYTIDIPDGMEVFFSTVTVTLDNTEHLSNGDEIKVTYSYDKAVARAQNLKVKGGKEYVKVEGLPEAQVISYDELFEAARITYSGAAPVATAQVENISTNEYLKNIEFTIAGQDEDNVQHYDIGDTITLEANVDTEALALQAVVIEPGPNGYEKSYTVEDIPQYITSADELSEDQLLAMREHAGALFSGDASEFGLRLFSAAGIHYDLSGSHYTFKWGSPVYVCTYFNHIKDDAIAGDTTHVNDVKIVVTTSVSQSDGNSVSCEAVVIYRNIMKQTDGTVDVDLESGEIVSASVKDSDIKKLVRNEDDDSYESVRLDE